MNMLKYFVLIVTGLAVFSCNDAPSNLQSGGNDSSMIQNQSTGTNPTDSAIYEMDTSFLPPINSESVSLPKIKKRKAVFGYSFFQKIQQNETRPVYAYVSILDSISKVIDTLQQINASEIPERKSDTAVIFTKNMFVFKAITVHLVNAGDSDFIIKPFSEARQMIDSMDGNSWSWEVTPLTHKKNCKLIMNVVVEKPDGNREPFSIINIPIVIQLDKGLGRIIWDWMMHNPEKVITIILIPFIIFFWKQITGLFKKKNEKKDQ